MTPPESPRPESPAPSANLFDGYTPLDGTWDELAQPDGSLRADMAQALELLGRLAPSELARLQGLCDGILLNSGVTFSVYSHGAGTEKIFPFDLVPRLIEAAAWDEAERGLRQRVQALELFLDDVYGEQRIFREGVIPKDLVLASGQYLAPLHGIRPPHGVRIHIAGIDLIRDHAGVFRVLEDNLRCPSGVSYVLQNRSLTKRMFPKVFAQAGVRGVEHYPVRLAEALGSLAPGRSLSASEPATGAPLCVVLTPGPYNSAYFEHTFLARTMGMPLVQAPDLFVDGDRVWLRTTKGPQRVDVIYRRTDEAFLDPEVFRPDSVLGVPGLIRAYAAGNVTLANAPGNGVADDKAVYAFVPDIVRYYLSEEPLLAQVPTYVCARDDDKAYVLEHLDELVVKAVDEAGGYGMLMGPTASAEERADFADRIRATPRKYIAQPRIELSGCPTWIPGDDGAIASGGLEARRVDLRPYIVSGMAGPWVLPGGLTRVALRRGSYVVNSSQGGGSKDTWVLKR